MSNDETVIPPHKAAMSYESWTRVPSTADVLFQLELPYTSPKSALGRCLWRWRVWFEITFALSMLQPWEKVVIMLMLHISLMFFMSTAYYYLPSHFAIIKTRTLYYLLGQEAADAGMSDSIQKFVAGCCETWNNTGISGALSSVMGSTGEL
ncbi:hypothetical protein C8Q75DRAFT_730737 [Abortiporus biennis]|nr:hypothetical protein C8Q75DRAFT_730737 [Abortiporus biennis]